ncbi:DUF1064 domain-containing protein [Aureimonas sp. AU20]|uniref:DUF1064 domain-containing protein n=1 Tax=Aureimonas sp. AU20 TaxID=1349819 RepID=UPI000721CBA8|nr:DUF1064 domain-containing protein [Aureimonas sp. AU20]ALN73551.1 hypothetical protein M673_12560 [Aureimonas sp. AU20]
MKNKYRAQKTEVDGITFDSKAEARRFMELRLLERAGEISDLKLQEPFACTVGDKAVVVCTYRADFSYWDNRQKRQRVEDVKGMDTPVSALKRRLVRALFGVEVEIVRAS